MPIFNTPSSSLNKRYIIVGIHYYSIHSPLFLHTVIPFFRKVLKSKNKIYFDNEFLVSYEVFAESLELANVVLTRMPTSFSYYYVKIKTFVCQCFTYTPMSPQLPGPFDTWPGWVVVIIQSKIWVSNEWASVLAIWIVGRMKHDTSLMSPPMEFTPMHWKNTKWMEIALHILMINTNFD